MSGKPSYAAVSAGKGAKGGKERQGSRSDKSQVGLKQQASQVSTPSAARGIDWDQEEDEEDDDAGSSSDEAKEEAGAVQQPDEAKAILGGIVQQLQQQQQQMMTQMMESQMKAQQQQQQMMESQMKAQQQQQQMLMESQMKAQQQQQQMMEAQMKAQQQQQQQIMTQMMEQLLRGQQRQMGSGPSMVPAPIAASVGGAGVASQAQPQTQTTSSSGGTVRKQLELEKLALFQGEMDSDKLDAWLRRLMVHCSYYGRRGGALEEEQAKVDYAAAHLEGAAADWWFTAMGKVTTMQQFIEAVNGRFRSAIDADVAAEKLYRLRQQKGQTVAQYAGLVHQLMLRIPDMAMSDRIRQFTRGLLPHLAQKVREVQPDTLESATELAIRYEGSFGVPGGESGGGKAGINTVQTTWEETEGTQQDSTAEQLKLVLAAIQRWQPRGGGGSQRQQGAGGGNQGQLGTATETPKEYCYRCGDKGHRTTDCTFDENVCYKCKEKGHARRQCPKNKRNGGAQGAGAPGGGRGAPSGSAGPGNG
jgi:Ty3 transposon capsid-like protein/Zinc knuckle